MSIFKLTHENTFSHPQIKFNFLQFESKHQTYPTIIKHQVAIRSRAR